MGLFKTIVGGAVGFMFGGPLGAAGGAVLANSLGGKDYKYDVNCPHCNKSLGVNEHGRFSCCGCNKVFVFTENGVEKDDRINVICPYCNGEVLIDHEGSWNCPYCNKDFDYGDSEEEQNEENFTYVLFALFSKMAKANGVITKDHIKVLEKLMDVDYNYDDETKSYAIDSFRHAKETQNNFEYYCMKINDLIKYQDDYELTHNVACGTIDSLYQISLADNSISNEEQRLIDIAGNIFKLEKHILEEIRSNYIDSDIDKYYEILGCARGDSLEVIKSKYRKLASEYHPDRIANKDLPDYLVQHSNDKFREIQEAYEYIKVKI